MPSVVFHVFFGKTFRRRGQSGDGKTFWKTPTAKRFCAHPRRRNVLEMLTAKRFENVLPLSERQPQHIKRFAVAGVRAKTLCRSLRRVAVGLFAKRFAVGPLPPTATRFPEFLSFCDGETFSRTAQRFHAGAADGETFCREIPIKKYFERPTATRFQNVVPLSLQKRCAVNEYFCGCLTAKRFHMPLVSHPRRRNVLRAVHAPSKRFAVGCVWLKLAVD